MIKNSHVFLISTLDENAGISCVTTNYFLARYASRFWEKGKLNPHVSEDAIWFEAESNAKKNGLKVRLTVDSAFELKARLFGGAL